MVDYKALCARLCGAIALADGKDKALDDAYTEAIAALAAEPQQGVPSDEWPNGQDLLALAEFYGIKKLGHQPAKFARAVLACYTPTPAPVAVGDRLPGDRDLNPLGMCWWYDAANGSWVECDRIYAKYASYAHWLPATALPLPEATP